MEALIILYAVIIILMAVSMWVVFTKAGQPGWAVLVPVYNLIIFMRIIEKPWWWILLWLIPYAQLIWIIWGWNLLAKKFGKSEGFTVGILLLSFVFLPMLAFGNAKYEGLKEGSESGGAVQTIDADTGDTMLMIVIIFMLVIALTNFLLRMFHANPYAGNSRYIQMVYGFASAFIPVVLGFVVKNKSIKILCIILGAIYAIFMIISNIQMIKYMVPY